MAPYYCWYSCAHEPVSALWCHLEVPPFHKDIWQSYRGAGKEKCSAPHNFLIFKNKHSLSKHTPSSLTNKVLYHVPSVPKCWENQQKITKNLADFPDYLDEKQINQNEKVLNKTISFTTSGGSKVNQK